MDNYLILWEYRQRIYTGFLTSLGLSICAFSLAFVLALIIFPMSISQRKVFVIIAKIYTFLLRSIPDLILLFIFFYSLENLLVFLKNKYDFSFNINSFFIASFSLAIIFSAYISESLRTGFLRINPDEITAGKSFNLSSRQIFWKIKFIQIYHYSFASISNNMLVLIKATALASLFQLDDLTKVIKEATNSNPIIKSDILLRSIMYLVGALAYVLLSFILILLLRILQRKISRSRL